MHQVSFYPLSSNLELPMKVGPKLPSWSHYMSLDGFAGGCADCSYIQLLPALPIMNEKQEKLACAEVCAAAAGWL